MSLGWWDWEGKRKAAKKRRDSGEGQEEEVKESFRGWEDESLRDDIRVKGHMCESSGCDRRMQRKTETE